MLGLKSILISKIGPWIYKDLLVLPPSTVANTATKTSHEHVRTRDDRFDTILLLLIWKYIGLPSTICCLCSSIGIVVLSFFLVLMYQNLAPNGWKSTRWCMPPLILVKDSFYQTAIFNMGSGWPVGIRPRASHIRKWSLANSNCQRKICL